jgi:hypothetical protein
MSARTAKRRARVNPQTGCWEWDGCSSQGYGRTGRNSTKLAHRAVYERFCGEIPEGMVLDHLCRNTVCCNPAHLEAVTNTENCRRGAGAKLTMEDARAIRASTETSAALARQYGVVKNTIYNIRSGRTWKEEVPFVEFTSAPENPHAR